MTPQGKRAARIITLRRVLNDDPNNAHARHELARIETRYQRQSLEGGLDYFRIMLLVVLVVGVFCTAIS